MPAPFEPEDFPDRAAYEAAVEAFLTRTFKPPTTPEEHRRAQDCLVEAVACCMEEPVFTREALEAECCRLWPEGAPELVTAAVDRALAEGRLGLTRGRLRLR